MLLNSICLIKNNGYISDICVYSLAKNNKCGYQFNCCEAPFYSHI